MNARNKRINAYGRAVFDIYSLEYFMATVEVNSNAPGMIRVLYGAMLPRGKEKAWDAIRAYENGRNP